MRGKGAGISPKTPEIRECSLARRPFHLAAANQVEVDVEDGLIRVPAAVGDDAEANMTNAVALGSGAGATGVQSTATGVFAVATGTDSTATGAAARATFDRSVAIGGDGTDGDLFGARARGLDSVAIGNDADAGGVGNAFNTTALGAAYLPGLSVGYRDSSETIERLWRTDREFEPRF